MKHAAVFHIPHSSVYVPDDVRKSLVLDDQELKTELLKMTDHYTEELFSEFGNVFTYCIYSVSRLVVDPERFTDDANEPMASKGMGVIYTATHNGNSLRGEAPGAQERQSLLDRFYWPHHEKLTESVGDALESHGYCLLIDCHSFPSWPLPYEIDQSLDRPDICLGTCDFHTPRWVIETAKNAFESEGFLVKENTPFEGVLIPMEYYSHNSAVMGLMIEIKRSLYMDENTGDKNCSFVAFSKKLQRCLNEIISTVEIKSGKRHK